MWEHEFHTLDHLRIGPLRNSRGWIFAVAEIGDSWFLRWCDPHGLQGSAVFADHDDCIRALEMINRYDQPPNAR